MAQIDGAVLPLHRGGYHPPPCCGFQSGQTQQFLTATARMKQKTQIVFICLQTVFAGHRFVSFPCCSPGAAHENSSLLLPLFPGRMTMNGLMGLPVRSQGLACPVTGLTCSSQHRSCASGMRSWRQPPCGRPSSALLLPAFLFHQRPWRQEVGFTETSSGELSAAGQERLDSHIIVRKSHRPCNVHHCLQGSSTQVSI